MAQYGMNLRDYWLIVRRRRLIIIVSTLLVAALSFWWSRQRPPIYESISSVRYEQAASLTGLLVEVLAVGGGGDVIETQRAVIKSYPVLEEALRRWAKLPERPAGPPPRESRADLNAVEALAAKIRTARVGRTAVIDITATARNPGEAREIADTVAESYRDHNRQLRHGRISEVRTYIEKQIEEAEGRVAHAEEQVWAYREANSIIAPGAESTVLLSLFMQLRGGVETSRQQRTELEGAQARLADIEPGSFTERVFVETANPLLQRLQTVQVDLLFEYNNLARDVTDRQPRLQALGDRMREVRLEMRREIGAQIAFLKNREEILRRQMGEVLRKNREVPPIELGLQRLQRDAKTNEDLLTLLRTKHQDALIKESERVEEVAIVRPATEPEEPVSTDSLNTVAIGTLLGLMLGLVLAFVQETLGPETAAGRFARVWASVRGRRAATPTVAPDQVAGKDLRDAKRVLPQASRYTNVIWGVVVVLLLLAVIVGIAARHMGWLPRDGRARAPERRAGETATPSTDVAKAPAPAASVSAPPPAVGKMDTARFAVEFGPFVTIDEAEKTERQLNEAGHQTVRFRQETGAALYAVLIEHLPGPRQAETLLATLREQGFAEGVVVRGNDRVAVRVGAPMLLRAAVQLGESLRAKGHQVRVAAQPGQAQTFVIRHGNFASREEAEATGAELARLSLPNRVVRAK